MIGRIRNTYLRRLVLVIGLPFVLAAQFVILVWQGPVRDMVELLPGAVRECWRAR